MATKLKIVNDVADIVPAPKVPDFDIAPTRKRHAGWTAERQRKFIEHLALTGHVGEACALVGVASSSAYRLKHKIAKGTPLLSRIESQAPMQRLRHIFHLQVCHGVTVACRRHAFKGFG